MRRGVFWRDMGVVNLRSGQPTMALTGGALARLNEIMPAGPSGRSIHLTLTDDHPYAQAFVIIEAVKEAGAPPRATAPFLRLDRARAVEQEVGRRQAVYVDIQEFDDRRCASGRDKNIVALLEDMIVGDQVIEARI